MSRGTHLRENRKVFTDESERNGEELLANNPFHVARVIFVFFFQIRLNQLSTAENWNRKLVHQPLATFVEQLSSGLQIMKKSRIWRFVYVRAIFNSSRLTRSLGKMSYSAIHGKKKPII